MDDIKYKSLPPNPYKGKRRDQYKKITEDLVSQYPLSLEEIKDIVMEAWCKVGEITVAGKSIFETGESGAIGIFFQKELIKALMDRHEGWRGEKDRTDKDIVYVSNPLFSTEVKVSGQLGKEIYGNASFNHKGNELKDKSGYYITVNFYKDKITIIRIGWIDKQDWIPQKSKSGQCANLSPDTYTHKMIEVPGEHQKHVPVELLNRVGEKTAERMHGENVFTLEDLLDYKGIDPIIKRVKEQNSYSINPGVGVDATHPTTL